LPFALFLCLLVEAMPLLLPVPPVARRWDYALSTGLTGFTFLFSVLLPSDEAVG
jgi:D-ribose pyranose/furanose isomerase RbsD